jgi:hypothetical protein
MMDRTEWDDMVDEAIEVLIAEDTESFVLVGTQGEDVHVVQGADGGDELVAIWALVTQVMSRAQETGQDLRAPDVLALAAGEAAERGLLEPGAGFEEI